jgi:plastocyanin
MLNLRLTLNVVRVTATLFGLLASLVLVSRVSAASSPDQSVTIDAFAFSPQEISVPTGATVAWVNTQPSVRHTATSLDGSFDSGTLSTNDTFAFTFAQAGDFAYQCEIHPSMRGIVHVVADTASVTPGDMPAISAAPPNPAGFTPATTAIAPPPIPTATPAPSYGY